MARWSEFESQAPEMAAAGRKLLFQFGRGLAYLATIRPDGGPRLHPIAPSLEAARLRGTILPGPKLADLARDPRFALHTPGPEDTDDEFYITGTASVLERRDDGAAVVEFDIERALLATYRPRAEGNTWPPKYDRWSDATKRAAAKAPAGSSVPHTGLPWHEFAAREPELAARGREIIRQFGIGLGFMATVRRDGGPRLHPFCPTFSGEGLYGLILGASPKCRDLLRDGRVAVHACQPIDRDDEFVISGTAELIESKEMEDQVRTSALADGMTSTNDETLFEFRIERALLATYKPRGEQDNWPPAYTTWRLGQPVPVVR